MPPYRMESMELAGGWVFGFEGAPLPADTGVAPRQVLEESLRDCLAHQPCMVAFSGGRDSSALLAVAVHVARREGLPLPIPLILRYTDAPGSEESEWQQLVLDHLALREHVVITVGGEHNPIGPFAAPLLRRHGVMWPPNFTPTWRMMDASRGGVLVLGEGGDEVFGRRRIAPVTALLRSRRTPTWRLLRSSLGAVAPGPVRVKRIMRGRSMQPWLRGPAHAFVAEQVVAEQLAYSLHAGRQAWQFNDRRALRRLVDTFTALGDEIGTGYRAPLCEPGFVAAFAHSFGRWGAGDRTEVMTRLFGDFLPASVLGRASKANFRHAVLTDDIRIFAQGWNGFGVDHSMVDPEALRDNWLSERRNLAGLGLLQAAWLATTLTDDTTV